MGSLTCSLLTSWCVLGKHFDNRFQEGWSRNRWTLRKKFLFILNISFSSGHVSSDSLPLLLVCLCVWILLSASSTHLDFIGSNSKTNSTKVLATNSLHILSKPSWKMKWEELENYYQIDLYMTSAKSSAKSIDLIKWCCKHYNLNLLIFNNTNSI